MVLIQINLSEDLNKKLGVYSVLRGFGDKRKAILEILENQMLNQFNDYSFQEKNE